MARPTAPGTQMQQVSGNPAGRISSMAGSAAVYKKQKRSNPADERNQIAKRWQIEAYRHVKICGEARYAATLFASIAGRAEIGVSEPDALGRKAVWVESGPEVEAFAEIAPTVRERSKLIRDYMLHRIIAGESYLIARERRETDPGYEDPPINPETGEEWTSWEDYLKALPAADLFDPEYDAEEWVTEDPNIQNPIWEIVGVTDIQKTGDGSWEVRHDNNLWLKLKSDDPVIRMWNPDPENRREAWSPFQALLPTLKEIEWETAHIFKQLRSRLVSAGVWFLPDNLTFPPPPPDSVEGGAEAIAAMNEAELFMISLAQSGMTEIDAEEVSFPSVVMGDPIALESIDQKKLIQFWSEIDDKAMLLRSDAVRRFALGMDLVPEDVLGASGLAVTGAGGSAGSVNHWGVWANEEKTISNHIEPALDDLVSVLTVAVLRRAVENTLKVIGYDSASLRLRQDRSEQAIELYDRGLLTADVTLRENGFDPQNDKMGEIEFKRWLLVRIAGGSATPEQVQAAMKLLGQVLPVEAAPEKTAGEPAPGQPGRNEPPNTDDHPYQGPPREQHDHTDAPYASRVASAEMLVLRALEKSGNVLLNDRKRGRDRDRTTPKHLAHLSATFERTVSKEEFDFGLASTALGDLPAKKLTAVTRQMGEYCARLYNEGEPYTREGLIEAVGALR